MNQLTKILAVAESVLLIITSSCKKDLADNRVTDQNNAIARAKSVQPSLQSQLMTGLGGGLGQYNRPWSRSVCAPDGKAGSILRIDPKTGDYTTFASGLPQLIPEVGIGGISDVAFLNEKAYVLVTLVDDPTFPTSQINGIYRIDGPNSFKVIADIGAYNIARPPTGFPIDVLTGVCMRWNLIVTVSS